MSLRTLALALALAFPATVLAHGGEDHGAPAITQPAAPPATGFAAEGTWFQAVLVPERGRTLVYVAESDTNAPVAGAVVQAQTPAWSGEAAPAGEDGVYALDWAPPPEGADVTLVLMQGARDDLLLIGGLGKGAQSAAPAHSHPNPWPWAAGGMGAVALVGMAAWRWRRGRAAALALLAVAALAQPRAALAHGGEDHSHGEPAAPAPAAPGTPILVPKATQFLLGIRTERVEPRDAAETVRVPGRVIPDPAGYARIQPSQAARVVADPAHPIPVPGQKVARGQIVAVLEPTLSTLEKGDKRASLTRVDGEIALAERELGRQVALGNLVPAKQVEITRIRLDQLRRERGQITGTALGREYLMAPVDGVVTDVHLVPGEVADTARVLVEIVDPARLRIEAVIHDLPLARRIAGATATSALLPDMVVGLTALGVSPKIDPQDQGLHALFQVATEQAPALGIGLPVDVHLATGGQRLALAVPREAVVERGGRDMVFVRTAPEQFEARPVTVLRRIGGLAELAGGVRPGERVVTQGAAQLKAAR